MEEIQHPTKPLELFVRMDGRVILQINKHDVGDFTDAGFVPFTQSDFAAAAGAGVQMPQGTQKPAMLLEVSKPVGLRPELVAWVEEALPRLRVTAMEKAKEYAARKAEAAAARAKEDEEDARLIAEMEAEVEQIRSQIPSDHVEVQVTKTGNFDGYPVLDYRCEGVTLRWDQVTMVGQASAIRAGALGAFQERFVGMISRSDLEIAKAERESEKQAKEDAKTRHLQKLNAPVPAAAVEAYRECRGNPELFPDDIDDPRYWLVRNHAEAIEHQGLASDVTMRKIAGEVSMAAREENYGIADDTRGGGVKL